MTQQPIPSDLGRRAYTAYGEAVGGLTHDGRILPTWEDLGEQIQTAWMAAARTAFLLGGDGR
ncbi:hypothetical protein ABZX85_41860 [Streptomyces sp. NPDC004539]|uniref:hypothetical protein n=1 Tax=Streptomyces sp. NPDC004539 TaxID=3154280 RepID=UPI0033A821A7